MVILSHDAWLFWNIVPFLYKETNTMKTLSNSSYNEDENILQ